MRPNWVRCCNFVNSFLLSLRAISNETTMDIELEKLELIKLLEATNDVTIIASIKKIFNASKKDFWEELTDAQKLEIEEGERQIERGEFVDFDEFIQKYLKYMK